MTEFQEIKEKIYKDNKIITVLELLDCWSIDSEQKGKLIVAGLPDGDNSRSVQIKNTPNLNAAIRSKGINGDIFDVISYILYEADTEEKRKNTLHKSKYWVCEQFEYYEYIDDFYKETSDNIQTVHNYNKWLSNIKKHRNISDRIKNQTLPEDVLKQYEVIPYKKWLDEGIKCSTQKLFGVGIDVKSDRVTFPVHNRDGALVGVKARYCGSEKSIEQRYKYLYLYPCNKSIEFFNLHRAMPHIEDKKEVVIVEGGKTTMYLHQWGFRNSISIEGDSLSETQIMILKDLGRDYKFIFAFDKDKDANYVKNEASKLTGRIKYGLLDIENYLEDKDSPCDRGKDVWEKLYHNHCYKI